LDAIASYNTGPNCMFEIDFEHCALSDGARGELVRADGFHQLRYGGRHLLLSESSYACSQAL